MGKGSISKRRVHNRIFAVMVHTTRYAFKGESRLAADAGVSKSAICRLLSGQSSPSFVLVTLVTRALEKALNKTLDPRELISLDGTYPTASICQVAGCSGCLPAQAHDEEGNLKPEFKGTKPGQWSISQSPVQKRNPRKRIRAPRRPCTRSNDGRTPDRQAEAKAEAKQAEANKSAGAR